MDFEGKLIVTDETKQKAKDEIEKAFEDLKIDFEMFEKELKFTELTVTMKLDTPQAIKQMFKAVKAPADEIKFIAKAKSIVAATARDLLHGILSSIKDR